MRAFAAFGAYISFSDIVEEEDGYMEASDIIINVSEDDQIYDDAAGMSDKRPPLLQLREQTKEEIAAEFQKLEEFDPGHSRYNLEPSHELLTPFYPLSSSIAIGIGNVFCS